MHTPLVSVVIATFNAGSYLKEAIDSVLNQTVRDLELIVIDDGSTDETRALVASVQEPRLHYHWQPNSGQTVAKNHGIRKARGAYVAFCDGDDYWYPDKLEVQLPLFEKSPRVGVVYSEAQAIDASGRPLVQVLPAQHRGNLVETLFMRNVVPFGTAVVRRQCLEELGAFDESLRMGIDWDLWLRISTRYEFDYVPRPTYAYRIWPGQMSTNWRGRYSSAFRIMDKFVAENPGLIRPRLRRKAIADTYANRARARSRDQRWGAVGDALRAAAHDPGERYAWASLARVTRDAVRRPIGQHLRGRLLDAAAPTVLAATRTLPRIFMYHRFGDSGLPNVMAVRRLREQIESLDRRFEFVTVRDLFAPGRDKRRPRIAITVDDGYADFHERAFPVLRAMGVPATVFVTGGFIEGDITLWPDRVRALVTSAPSKLYRLGGYWDGLEIDLRTGDSRAAAWHLLADRLTFESLGTRDQALAELTASLQAVPATLDMSACAAMTWEQLREIHAAGFEVGNHSYSHACLTTLSDADLRADLTRCHQMIEGNLSAPVRSFAYPNGTLRDIDARVPGLLDELGYEQALLSVRSPVSSASRMQLGRYSGDCDLRQFRRLAEGYGVLRSVVTPR